MCFSYKSPAADDGVEYAEADEVNKINLILFSIFYIIIELKCNHNVLIKMANKNKYQLQVDVFFW